MNYLIAQDTIAARLRLKLPASIPVRTAIDIAEVKDQSSANPEVWVVFNRDIVRDHSASRTLLEQQWMVIYIAPGILPNVSQDGETLTALTKALAGYDADIDGVSEFKRIGSMVPQTWASAGTVAYGMLFSVSLDM
jgi:hypothetical protein